MPLSGDDVPSPIDLKDRLQARAWVEDTVARRPFRPRFFAAFVKALDEHFAGPFSLIELGSGPGHLAAAILESCRVRSYVALDFSEAMHALAREHLGPAAASVDFATVDFRDDWDRDCQGVDAIVTMQAAHEVRHKRHQPVLFSKVHNALRSGGLFLFCDHYFEPGSGKHHDLYFERTEQPRVLAEAGFSPINLLLDDEGMALYACCR